MTIRFTNIACPTFDPIVITELKCNIKAYSRTYSVANFNLMVTKSLMKVMLGVIIEYKYGTMFREGN